MVGSTVEPMVVMLSVPMMPVPELAPSAPTEEPPSPDVVVVVVLLLELEQAARAAAKQERAVRR